MKRNQEHTGARPFVSIGMIVKNEEKHLRECLEALTPLREQVPCELIIADTGSVDSTWEIAEEFADQLFHFEWCDDFSAARNSTLEKARGKWYMYLDGDEIFGDLTDLIEFFQSEDNVNYNAASYIQRNYGNFEHTIYNDFNAMRIYRIKPGTKFHFAIHETIPYSPPIKNLTSFVHHDGYIYASEEDRRRKQMRNRTLLLKILEKDPENVRAIGHLVKDFGLQELEEMREYIERGLKCARKKMALLSTNVSPAHYVETYIYFFFVKKGLVYYHQATRNSGVSWEELTELCREYFSLRKTQLISDLDMYYYWGYSLEHQQRYEEAVEPFQKYVDLFQIRRAGQLNTADMYLDAPLRTGEASYQQVLSSLYSCCAQSGRFEDAFRCLDRYLEEKRDVSREVYYCATESGMYEKLEKYYQEVAEKTPYRLNDYLKLIAQRYEERPATREGVDRALGEASERYPAVPYFHLCRVRFLDREQADPDTVKTELLWFREMECPPEILSEVLFMSMKYRAGFTELLDSVSLDRLPELVRKMLERHETFAGAVRDYFRDGSPLEDGLPHLYVGAMLTEMALLSGQLQKQEIPELFQLYLKALDQYTVRMYHPEVFNNEEIVVLPGSARFSYRMRMARKSQETGDNLGYVREVRKALSEYPQMAEPVALLLEEFEKEREPEPNPTDEFSMLAQKFKESIRLLMEKGDIQNATELLSKYETIRPDDPEIAVLRKLMPIQLSDR